MASTPWSEPCLWSRNRQRNHLLGLESTVGFRFQTPVLSSPGHLSVLRDLGSRVSLSTGTLFVQTCQTFFETHDDHVSYGEFLGHFPTNAFSNQLALQLGRAFFDSLLAIPTSQAATHPPRRQVVDTGRNLSSSPPLSSRNGGRHLCK